MRALAGYDWPGNIRELANLVERLSILHGGRSVDVHDLPARYRAHVADADPPAAEEEAPLSDAEALQLLEGRHESCSLTQLPAEGIDLRGHLDAIERALVQQALERSSGTVAHAARLLGLRRTTLVEKLRKLGDPALESAGVLTERDACRAAV